jgi:glycine betaine/proline transport system substrate-binding protein
MKGGRGRAALATAPNLQSVLTCRSIKTFSRTPRPPPRGVSSTAPSGWEATTINSLKLDEYWLLDSFTDFVSGSDTALSSSLASAYEQGKPWFGYYWSRPGCWANTT